MALFTPRCPVDDRERTWITENIGWLRGQFGDAPLSAPMVLPTSEYFPPPFSGSDQDIRSVVSKAGGYMGVQTDVDIEVSDDIDHIRALQRIIPAGTTRSAGAAGTYTVGAEDGRPVITIDRSTVSDPVRLVAVIAHELGHVRLLSEDRLPAGRKDGEPLTDLATVYLSMGIFTANAAFDFSRLPADGSQRTSGWRAQRLGYMTEPMLGFALACFAMLRTEPDPPWARYLDTNPRVYMKHGLRYLRHTMPQRPGGQPRLRDTHRCGASGRGGWRAGLGLEEELLSQIQSICEAGFIFVRDEDDRICGIVTSADLGDQFRDLTSPFFQLGEIEGRVRRCIDRTFTADELRAATGRNKVNSAADMMFGQYVDLLKDEARWQRMHWDVDRALFIGYLDETRKVRNRVMHFGEELKPEDKYKLRQCLNFMRALDLIP